MALGNRGPIRFTDEGRLHPDILATYNHVGFYVFENVLGAGEESPVAMWAKPLGADWRVTVNVGFHRRRSVLGVTGFYAHDNEPMPYDAERIRKRCEMIGYAIAARHQRFPQETPYDYQPHLQSGE
jgi:hypothetical protein